MSLSNNSQRIMAVLAAAASVANAYSVTYYGSRQCTGQRVDNAVFGPGKGCQSLGGATSNAASMTIQSTGPVDDPFMMVLFESDDCNPDTIVAYGDEDDGCLKADEGKSFHSYQVWDLWE